MLKRIVLDVGQAFRPDATRPDGDTTGGKPLVGEAFRPDGIQPIIVMIPLAGTGPLAYHREPGSGTDRGASIRSVLSTNAAQNSSLPADIRPIAMWKFEGFTHEEIASKLGYTLRTVERKARLIREKWDRTIPNTTE
jgi:ECF sigma factor